MIPQEADQTHMEYGFPVLVHSSESSSRRRFVPSSLRSVVASFRKACRQNLKTSSQVSSVEGILRYGNENLPAGHVTRFKMAENICTIFSLFSTFVQRSHKIQMSRSKFFKVLRKILHGNRFVIEILMKTQQIFNRDREHMRDSKWMIYPELSSDVTDGHGPKWCIKMDKLFVLDYLSPCFIKLGVNRLCIFCVMQLPESHENKRFVYI